MSVQQNLEPFSHSVDKWGPGMCIYKHTDRETVGVCVYMCTCIRCLHFYTLFYLPTIRSTRSWFLCTWSSNRSTTAVREAGSFRMGQMSLWDTNALYYIIIYYNVDNKKNSQIPCFWIKDGKGFTTLGSSYKLENTHIIAVLRASLDYAIIICTFVDYYSGFRALPVRHDGKPRARSAVSVILPEHDAFLRKMWKGTNVFLNQQEFGFSLCSHPNQQYDLALATLCPSRCLNTAATFQSIATRCFDHKTITWLPKCISDVYTITVFKRRRLKMLRRT